MLLSPSPLVHHGKDSCWIVTPVPWLRVLGLESTLRSSLCQKGMDCGLLETLMNSRILLPKTGWAETTVYGTASAGHARCTYLKRRSGRAMGTFEGVAEQRVPRNQGNLSKCDDPTRILAMGGSCATPTAGV